MAACYLLPGSQPRKPPIPPHIRTLLWDLLKSGRVSDKRLGASFVKMEAMLLTGGVKSLEQAPIYRHVLAFRRQPNWSDGKGHHQNTGDK